MPARGCSINPLKRLKIQQALLFNIFGGISANTIGHEQMSILGYQMILINK